MRGLRAASRGLGELLITAGLVLLLFVAWQLWWTDVTANRAQAKTMTQLQQEWVQHPTSSPGGMVNGTIAKVPLGDAFALIRIPRFGKKYVKPILQGTDLAVLDRGVGHYVHTQMPGEIGNFAIAGHRVTYGRPFNEIATLKPGDPIVIETATTWYVYRVQRHVIVTPDHVEVVAPVPQHPGRQPTVAMMTMTACNPEYSARQRYVLFSTLEQTLPKEKGKVPDVLTQGRNA